MKVNLLRKAKWWLLAVALIVALMATSISYSAWDNFSLKTQLANSGSGKYAEKPDTKYELKTDNNSNGIADVGDTVTFGNYYQTNATQKTAIEWRVVEKKTGTSGNQELTLLAEKVMAFGSFWGNQYHNGSSWVYATQANGTYYQNYSKSTVRAWLNSYYTGTDARNDAGTAFSASGAVAFRGFMNEAFTKDEQDYIISKTISGMKGYQKDSFSYEPYATITDKVWLPSWTEIYGNVNTPNGAIETANISDGKPNTQFSYFAPNNATQTKAAAATTAFASLAASNYTVSGISNANNWQGSSAGGNVWWWLRSPTPSDYGRALMVHTGGSGGSNGTRNSFGGVRPAVIVPVQ